jgi:hypothetical protein
LPEVERNVRGDGVRSIQNADAQQNPPRRAASARAEGSGDGSQGAEAREIRWIGCQWLMSGYCGRADAVGGDVAAATPAPRSRVVASVPLLERHRRVVRVGPRPPQAEDATAEGTEVGAA